MKYGIVLPSHVYNPVRVQLARHAFDTLEKTENDSNKPVLMILYKYEGAFQYNMAALKNRFDARLIQEPSGVGGTEPTLAWGTQLLFDEGMDYVTWMGDDALFHPQWHLKLRQLITDKPNALGWSVYRSAYEKFHTTELEEGDYVRVSSLCGHGMTISKQEWKDWGIDWRTGFWASPGCDTLDMNHAYARQGERWTTAVSYVEHTGKVGVHCTAGTPEWAREFQGCN